MYTSVSHAHISVTCTHQCHMNISIPTQQAHSPLQTCARNILAPTETSTPVILDTLNLGLPSLTSALTSGMTPSGLGSYERERKRRGCMTELECNAIQTWLQIACHCGHYNHISHSNKKYIFIVGLFTYSLYIHVRITV